MNGPGAARGRARPKPPGEPAAWRMPLGIRCVRERYGVAALAGSDWRFNPPPGWPPPPPGWVPPAGFRGDPSWPSPPAGWQWWVPQSLVPAQRQPIPQAQWAAAGMPAAGASRRRGWRTADTVLLAIGAVLVLVALVFAAVVTPAAKPVAQSQAAPQSAPEVQPSSAAPDPVATPSPSPSPSPSAAAVAVAPAHGLVVVGGVALPDRALTPGEVFVGATSSIICVSGYSSRVRHVTASEYVSVYAAYRLGYPAPPGAYELDHLIPLELGGDNSTRNLWPSWAWQPRSGPSRPTGTPRTGCTGARLTPTRLRHRRPHRNRSRRTCLRPPATRVSCIPARSAHPPARPGTLASARRWFAERHQTAATAGTTPNGGGPPVPWPSAPRCA